MGDGFHVASVRAVEFEVTCPVCEHVWPGPEMHEDDDGAFAPDSSEEFTTCPECEALIQIPRLDIRVVEEPKATGAAA